MPNRTRLKARKAFSFIEVTIVLVILGVLLSLAAPRYAEASRSMRVNQAANVVAADMELAASIAAQRRVTLDLRQRASAPGYELVTRDSGRVVFTRVLGADSEWKLAAAEFSPASVAVYPGGTWSTGLRIVLRDGANQRAVTVTRAGLVRVIQ